eukprot:930577-Pleurochrysis_carterae.AAC.2
MQAAVHVLRGVVGGHDADVVRSTRRVDGETSSGGWKNLSRRAGSDDAKHEQASHACERQVVPKSIPSRRDTLKVGTQSPNALQNNTDDATASIFGCDRHVTDECAPMRLPVHAGDHIRARTCVHECDAAQSGSETTPVLPTVTFAMRCGFGTGLHAFRAAGDDSVIAAIGTLIVASYVGRRAGPGEIRKRTSEKEGCVEASCVKAIVHEFVSVNQARAESNAVVNARGADPYCRAKGWRFRKHATGNAQWQSYTGRVSWLRVAEDACSENEVSKNARKHEREEERERAKPLGVNERDVDRVVERSGPRRRCAEGVDACARRACVEAQTVEGARARRVSQKGARAQHVAHPTAKAQDKATSQPEKAWYALSDGPFKLRLPSEWVRVRAGLAPGALSSEEDGCRGEYDVHCERHEWPAHGARVRRAQGSTHWGRRGGTTASVFGLDGAFATRLAGLRPRRRGLGAGGETRWGADDGLLRRLSRSIVARFELLSLALERAGAKAALGLAPIVARVIEHHASLPIVRQIVVVAVWPHVFVGFERAFGAIFRRGRVGIVLGVEQVVSRLVETFSALAIAALSHVQHVGVLLFEFRRRERGDVDRLGRVLDVRGDELLDRHKGSVLWFPACAAYAQCCTLLIGRE